jgi:CrcB protein
MGTWVTNLVGVGFPYGTIAINTIGSFFIVVVTQLAARGAITDHVRLALTTGVLGGFTTYSSFNNETMYFLQRGSVGLALLNHGATIVLCLIAGAAGFLVAR